MMIPNSDFNNIDSIVPVTRTDNTYKINKNGTVYGFIDDRDALRQWVVTALSTERYRYPIYSWNFGLETEDLYGREPQYAMSVLQSRIHEALTIDERITGLTNYNSYHDKGSVYVSFTLNTIFDDQDYEKEFTGILL